MEVLQLFNSAISAEDIEAKLPLAESRVNAELRINGIHLPVDDINNLLRDATIFFVIDLLPEKIRLTSGVIDRIKQGAFDINFEEIGTVIRASIGGGTMSTFYNFLPKETWLMTARRLINAYVLCWIDSQYGYYGSSKFTSPMFHDNSKRGYGADRRYAY